MHLLSDLIVRIKTSTIADKKFTYVQYSKLVKNVLKVLKSSGYIKDFKVVKKDKFKKIKVYLDYENRPINDIKVVSKPGGRIYMDCRELKKKRMNVGLIVISTSKGIVSSKEAIKISRGGEVLLKVL